MVRMLQIIFFYMTSVPSGNIALILIATAINSVSTGYEYINYWDPEWDNVH